MIGRSGERGSGISVLAARQDDDDDDDIFSLIHISLNIITFFVYISFLLILSNSVTIL